MNADFVKMADIQAMREQLAGRIVAATGIESNIDSMFINGKEERLLVIGSRRILQAGTKSGGALGALSGRG